MATATATRRTRKAAPKPAPEPEVVEEELEDEVEEEEPELEEEEDEVEELDESEPAPKGTKQKASAQERAKASVTFGVIHIAEYLNSKLAAGQKEVTTRELRQMIRAMARDDSGRVDRDIVPGNRARYDWPKGLKDPEVKAIIAAFRGGEAENLKKDALDALKARNDALRAAKQAAAEAPVAKATTNGKAKAAPAAKAKAAPAKRTTRKAAPVVEVEEDDEELDLEDE